MGNILVIAQRLRSQGLLGPYFLHFSLVLIRHCLCLIDMKLKFQQLYGKERKLVL